MNSGAMERTSYDGQSNPYESSNLTTLAVIRPPKTTQDAEQIRDGKAKKSTVVAALNFGKTYSGYAFSTESGFKLNPLNISTNEREKCTNRPLFGERISTCILFNSEKNFISLGYDAEKEWVNYGEEYRKDCRFYRHFYSRFNSDKEVDVIKENHFAISEFLKKLFDYCKSAMKGLELGEVKRWVITIPAEMTDKDKDFLKNCIEKAGIPLIQLTLVTEAKASFAYCQKLLESKGNSKLDDSTEYMIVDFGDYDADIRVVKKFCDELKEKYRQTNTKRTTSVYKQFLDVLCKLLGEQGMTILKRDPVAFLEIERGLEEVKLPEMREKEMRVQLHQSTLDNLRNLWYGKDGKNDPQIEITDREMILKQSTFRPIFEESILHVTSQIEKVFEVYREANNISHIVMTGDFYQCCLVKENVISKINFPQKRIICSATKEEAVVKGAVLYGWQPYKHTFELLRAYDKPADQKGYAMIINFEFKGTKHERKGSEEDARHLLDFFNKNNYYAVWLQGTTSEELENQLEKARKEVMEKYADRIHSFICVIMSHGNHNGICTTSGIIPIEKIVSPFKNDQAEHFIGKPKIFLIQACRGRGEHDLNKYEIPHDKINTDNMEGLTTPTDADIMTIYATTPGYLAMRQTQSHDWIGAWFIHAFITAAEMYPKNHLLEILTAVNYELANNPEYVFKDGKKGQMSMAEVTLTKLFYLLD